MIAHYLATHYIELLGFAFGITYVILAIRENYWCWIAGIVNVIMYIIVFYTSRLYGMMGLQYIYLLMSIYGFLHWAGLWKNKAGRSEVRVSRLPFRLMWVPTGFIVLGTIIIGYILTFTDNEIPFWDGLITAMGMAGTWMATRKILENWLLWIINDVICVIIYAYLGLYPTAIFYLFLAIMAIVGYRQWKKNLNPAGS